MKARFIAAIAAAAILLGACTGPGATSGPDASPVTSAGSGAGSSGGAGSGQITITDALDREVTFASPPSRIAINGKALFMIADAVYLFPEASSRIVALGRTSQNKLDFIPVIDPDYGKKTILEGEAGVDAIVATKPDAVILKNSAAESLGKPLEAVGVKVVYVEFETPEEYARDLATFGKLFANEARAQELIAYFQGRTDRVTKALSGIEEPAKPTVLLLYYSDKNGNVAFNVPPLSWMQSTEAELAGGRLVWRDAQLGSGWTTVSLEQIAAWDPDQIDVISYLSDVDEVVAKLKADPQWQGLTAVKNNAIHAFPGDYYSWDQPDPRWTLGLTWLASKTHPDRFGDLDMDAEIRGFYRDLYGLDDAAYEKDIRPHLSGELP